MSVPDAGDALVAVHDAARPLVTREIIARGWNAAIEKRGYGSGRADDRLHPACLGVRNVAVPHARIMSKCRLLRYFPPHYLRMHTAAQDITSMTDDASVAEAAGHRIALFDGSPYNMKVTDLLISALPSFF